ncbi:MAG: RloB domain-containing protein [Lachnospiraceae bacterium]|nr:RloB domain-containing protein [Lachnospiraceae bacterium]
MNIVKNTIKRAREEELVYKKGDLAFSIFDLDLDRSKEKQLEQARELSLAKKISLVTSNPCFEIWYLEHFGFTTKPFQNNAELINELKRFLPNYAKNRVDFDVLYPLTEQAIANCKKLLEYHNGGGPEEAPSFANPRTDVYRIVEIILRGGDKQSEFKTE